MDFRTNNNGKPFPIGSGWSDKVTFNKENVSQVPDKTGVYLFYDHNDHPIYIGRTVDREYSGLRHRLQSYYEKDDFEEHKTKRKLRQELSKGASFRWKATTENQAREIEMKLKQGLKYNADNHMNEEKKHHHV